MTDHTRGLLLTAFGVLFISPDTLLIRLVDMDAWNIAIWRGVCQSIGLIILLVGFYRRRTMSLFREIGRNGWAIAVIYAGQTLTFLTAVEHTTVANVLIILASAPFFAALMSLVLLKEPVALRTWVAIVFTVSGIGLIVWDGLGRGTEFGDMMAILGAFLLALHITIVRNQRRINMIPALAVSGLLFAAIAAMVGSPVSPSGRQAHLLLVMGFLVLTPAIALKTLGPRYISAPEVSLLTLLETVLGPLWVWLVIRETPTLAAIAGGAIVLVALVVHSVLGIRAARGQTGEA